MARKFNDVWQKKARCLGVLTIFKQVLSAAGGRIRGLGVHFIGNKARFFSFIIKDRLFTGRRGEP